MTWMNSFKKVWSFSLLFRHFLYFFLQFSQSRVDFLDSLSVVLAADGMDFDFIFSCFLLDLIDFVQGL